MKHNYTDKMQYVRENILPMLEKAFQRGDQKYHGIQHSHSEHCRNRPPDADIRHVRECHVDVRLREAEDLADVGELDAALRKIESAIGYAAILHMRIQEGS